MSCFLAVFQNVGPMKLRSQNRVLFFEMVLLETLRNGLAAMVCLCDCLHLSFLAFPIPTFLYNFFSARCSCALLSMITAGITRQESVSFYMFRQAFDALIQPAHFVSRIKSRIRRKVIRPGRFKR